MKKLANLVHVGITLAAFLVLSTLAAAAWATSVEFDLSWTEPTTGGPVHGYTARCVDSSGQVVIDLVSNTTAASGSASNVAQGTGFCEISATGPGGVSAPAVASWSLQVTAPPGVPTEITITLRCVVESGVAVCEQV